jgi:hypothetical protein
MSNTTYGPVPPLSNANDNDAVSAVVAAALSERPNSIESGVLRAWSTRDPLDAAMAAASLHCRLRFGDDTPLPGAPQRPDVDQLVREWRHDFAPAVYLAAAERLVEITSRWADEQIPLADPDLDGANH